MRKQEYRRSTARNCVAVLLLLLGVYWLAAPASVSAHPKLVRSSPEAGSTLETPPRELELYLTEGVSLEFSTVTVYDRARREQPLGRLERIGGADGADGPDTTVRARFEGTLPPGVYTVVWRVLSTVDGHLIAGSFAFRVRGEGVTGTGSGTSPGSGSDSGTGAAGAEVPEEVLPLEGTADAPFGGSAENADPLRWLVRATMLAAAVFLLGGPILSLLVIEPSLSGASEAGEALKAVAARMFARAGAVAAVLLLIVLVLDLLMQVAAIGGTDLAGSLSRGDLARSVIETTRYGFTWALKALAALALAAIMLYAWRWSKRSGSGVWELGIAAASLLLLAQSLGSHAAAAADASPVLGLPIPVISDWLHLVVVATWVGGLGHMALALFPAFKAIRIAPAERRAFLGRSIPRFSRMAVLSVVVLAATGTYNLLIHSTDLGAILGSQYGQVLALKIGLFAALVGIGAVNFRRLSPLLRAEDGAASERGRGGEVAATSVTDVTSKTNKVGETEETGVARAVEQAGSDIESRPVRRLRRNIRMEVALAAIALLCAGGLTLLPPPSGAGGSSVASSGAASPGGTPGATVGAGGAPQDPTGSADAEPPTPIPTPRPATAGTSVGGYDFSLTVRPSLEGDELTLDINRNDAASASAAPTAPSTLPTPAEAAGAAAPLTDVIKVLFKITPQDVDAGSASYEATRQEDAGPDSQTWKATETILTLDGGYLVTAIVQRAESPDIKAAFRLDLSVETGLRASAAQVVDVRIATDPSPARNGPSTLTVTLVDGSRSPIEGARVIVNPFMPAHAHVEPTSVAQPVQGQPGAYSTKVEYDMGGAWLFIFNVERDGLPPIKTDASVEVIGPTATPKSAPVATQTPSPTAAPR